MNVLGDIDERFVTKEGKLTEQNYLCLLQLQQLLGGEIFSRLPRYADLNELESIIRNPEINFVYGIVTGQGLATWNGSEFVRASDDTTPITN